MNSPQNKVIHDNLTPLPTSWHSYPIFYTQSILHPSSWRVKGNHSAFTSPTKYSIVTQTMMKSTSLYSSVKFSPSSSISSDMKHPIYIKKMHIQTTFVRLLQHSAMLMHLPLYALEWLGFNFNHVSQIKRNVHSQVISSCCNLLVCRILQTKASPQITSFSQVTSSHLNIYDECDQHAFTPQTSNELSKVIQVEWVTPKNSHALGMFAPILLPTPTNDPPRSLSRRTICNSSRCALRHPMSHVTPLFPSM